jgi:hypothetical protein
LTLLVAAVDETTATVVAIPVGGFDFAVAVEVAVAVRVAVGVAFAVRVAVTVAVAVGVAAVVDVGWPVAVEVAVAVRVAVADWAPVAVTVAVGVTVRVAAAVGVAVRVAARVLVAVAVAVAVRVAVAVAVDVEVALAVAVEDGVGIGAFFFSMMVCDAFKLVPLRTNLVLKEYCAGANLLAFSVSTEYALLTRNCWENATWPDGARIFICNRYEPSEVPGFGVTVTPTWTICDWFDWSTPLAG